jgi:hypothetical protein
MAALILADRWRIQPASALFGVIREGVTLARVCFFERRANEKTTSKNQRR